MQGKFLRLLKLILSDRKFKYVNFYLSKNKFKDFFDFPFDIKLKIPPEASDALIEGVSILEKLGVTFRLTDGTALGLYRNGKFIPYDQDIDVDVLVGSSQDVKMIKKVFRKHKYKIGRIVVFDGRVQQLVFYKKNQVIFDIPFWYSKGDKIYNYVENGYVRTQNLEHFKILDEIEFNGHVYPIPGNIKEWLAMRYVTDWKIPKKYNNHWIFDCGDIEKINPDLVTEIEIDNTLNLFIEQNSIFWSHLNSCPRNSNLLIEEPYETFIIHQMALQALTICNAKRYRPYWLFNNSISLELLQSYDSEALYLEPKEIVLFSLILKLKAMIYYIKLLIYRDIISFKYDQVKYGDIIYDTYLETFKVGTVKHFGLGFYKLIYSCIKRHEIVKSTILNNNISAVLSSGQIGISGGVLVRTALRYNCEAYTTAGLHRSTLLRMNNLDDVPCYEYAPTKKEISDILSLNNDSFEEFYNKTVDIHFSGDSSMDAIHAFSGDRKIFDNKTVFCNEFKLDPNKKNIFIMLHAFTDHPHSHFRWMTFKDYADWFLETLEYAKRDRNVNWIFKRHPSEKFYPTKDIDFIKLFKHTPDNIICLGEVEKLDTRSLIYVADAIVTCEGSAGFEIPAMGGIPSYTAGDNHYVGYSFSLNSKTRQQYFNTLSKLKNVKRLSLKQQRTAKAVYIFIHYLSKVDSFANPVLTLEAHHDIKTHITFWNKVIELYNLKKDIILKGVDNNIQEVEKNEFKALRTSILEQSLYY